ncbi:filamentous hemagglutinin N-terminal domain-containing protein, partial [Aquabacterium sp. A3]|uniref:two-partner secretion domain-containing protein n=1 Tax=Aquabacterium sp. A3 TaxID=3132829 RepID=UPI00311972C7
MNHSSLNHTYRLVWSDALCTWVAVAEHVKGRGKSQAGRAAARLTSRVVASAAALLTGAALSGMAGLAVAGPTGGVVTSGQGSISTQGAPNQTVTTITQTSQQLNVNWQGFNVGAGEVVNFVQPSATALAVNQILDTNGSRILGQLNANGQVWLINPNGVMFGQGAQVNVGGLVASTLNPLSQRGDSTQVFGNGGTGSIVNQGSITATNGHVAFIGNTVSNAGDIQAHGGTVALGAGSQVSLRFADNQLLGLTVEQSTLNNLAENKGLIQANGGAVFLSAGARDSLLASVVNNEGVIEAKTVNHQEGKIILMGGMVAGTTKVAGTLDASAETGNGGFIETSAAKVDLSKPYKVTTKAHNTDGGTGKTGTWLIDPNDYTIAASGGNTTGTQLGTDLASNNVTISTATQGTAGGNGDIFVKDNVTWSSGNTLTLNAERNINVLATLDASQGSGGKVALNYGQGAVASGNTANYNFGLTDTGFTGKINLQAGDNFSTKLGSDGTVTEYKVITALGAQGSTTGTDLQGINGNLSGNYVLGADIDATASSSWNIDGALYLGFQAIGNAQTGFTGMFSGLGHSITNLTINRPSENELGLFGTVYSGTIRDVGVVNADVRGNNSVGALAGSVQPGNVYQVYSSGRVKALAQFGGSAGGLIGNFTSGKIEQAFSRAVVDGNYGAGGLIGSTTMATLSQVYATGAVTGIGSLGGLVGVLESSNLDNAYATGTVTGTSFNVGGLTGEANARIGGTYSISNAYANGSVNGGTSNTGGLIGSYRVETLYGSQLNITNSFWDTQSAGQTQGVGSGYTGTGVVGKTTAELQTVATYTGWNMAGSGGAYPTLNFSGTGSTWVSGSLSTPITYTLNALTGTYTYKASAFNLSDLWSSSSIFGADYSSWVAGTDYTFSQDGNTVTGFTNAGTYSGLGVSILKSGFSVASSGNTTGSLTIDAAKLSAVTGIAAANKTYDGTTAATLNTSAAQFTGLLAADVGKVNVASATGAFADKNAGTTKTVNISGITLGGTSAGNYALDNSGTTTTADIAKKAVTVSGITATGKAYDGTTSATVSTANAVYAGLVEG